MVTDNKTPAPSTHLAPAAYSFRLARSIAHHIDGTKEYINFDEEPRLSLTPPCVPEGSMKDFTPLYANPQHQSCPAGQPVNMSGQALEAVLKEMIDVATGEYEGHEEAIDPWTADNRAVIDRWQCVISDAFSTPALPPSPQPREAGQ